MTAESGGQSRHIDDSEAAAVIYAPGEYPVVEDRVRSHIATCEICAERISSLRAADREAGELLSILDVPVPHVSERAILRAGKKPEHPRTFDGYRRAAAVVAFMVAAAAAAAIPTSPLHRLIARALGTRGSVAGNTAAGTPARSVAAASPGVLITPESTLEVVFEGRGTGGAVHVRFVDGGRLSLSSADSGATYRVSTSRINVDQSSHGDFDLALPRALREVRIRVGGKVVYERRPGGPASPDSFTIQLSRRNPTTPQP